MKRTKLWLDSPSRVQIISRCTSNPSETAFPRHTRHTTTTTLMPPHQAKPSQQQGQPQRCVALACSLPRQVSRLDSDTAARKSTDTGVNRGVNNNGWQRNCAAKVGDFAPRLKTATSAGRRSHHTFTAVSRMLVHRSRLFLASGDLSVTEHLQVQSIRHSDELADNASTRGAGATPQGVAAPVTHGGIGRDLSADEVDYVDMWMHVAC